MVSIPTAVFFSITTLNPITPGGGVQLFIPKWNQKAQPSVQDSYLIDESDFQAGLLESISEEDIEADPSLGNIIYS